LVADYSTRKIVEMSHRRLPNFPLDLQGDGDETDSAITSTGIPAIFVTRWDDCVDCDCDDLLISCIISIGVHATIQRLAPYASATA
jgi:hypothetical protein